MRSCVIIPAFNEADNIGAVVKAVKSLNLDCIVVDDGSDDETSLIAKRDGAYLIRHDVRRGKGASLKDGFDYAKSQAYDTMVVMDADGQHEASDIPRFIDRARETGASVIVGNRMANPTGMPKIRIFTNRFMSAIISAICGQKIADTQCGYRFFSSKAIDDIEIEARKFEIDSELLIKLARKGYDIESIAIKSIYAKETSKIRPIRDAFRFIRFLVRIGFNRD